MADTSALKQIVEKLKDSNNVLVTVNSNPSVDELSAALGITLLINKLNKHATAVFSGEVPAAIEFLSPEKTFEGTVDSLRDFIIALDKEKADHLRYKVDGDMVKIFITPYRTTINEHDLDFSQGDYNVEAVLAIGVQHEDDLDRALSSHGRILHDATVAAISLGEPTQLGGIEWADGEASSYSEMLCVLADSLRNGKNIVDEQIANAFLTGIVAATNRFSNAKTSAKVMTIAAQLMSAGANQQLIATKLEEEQMINASETPTERGDTQPIEEMPTEQPKETQDDDGATGALSISHMPKGDVDQVAREVASKKSHEALERANEELSKHVDVEPAEPAEQSGQAEQAPVNTALAAEDELDRAIATPSPVASELPSVDQLHADILQASEPLGSTPQVQPESLLSNSRTPFEDTGSSEPLLGGTLNATTTQAEEDARRAIENDRNRTILSHGVSTYGATPPSFQSPLNATVVPAQPEMAPHNVFDDGPDGQPTGKAHMIEPPAPMQSAPTLAQIDAQNRLDHVDARTAIDEALNAATSSAAPVQTQDAVPGFAPLPPMPPMPDFSTLPPLPGESALPESDPNVTGSLGNVLPPAPALNVEPQPQSTDPAQFRIPGQP